MSAQLDGIYNITIIPSGGQLGPEPGGFERISGESQVMQVVTKWRLNVSV